MSMNTDPIKKSQSSLDFKGEPIWFHSFLTLFNCESVPKILFTRAAQPLKRWSNAGELVRIDLNCLRLVYPRFEGPLGQPSWSERYTDVGNRRSYVEDLIERGDAVADEIEKLNSKSLLIILAIVAAAFPEPWCEIIWEDVQEELWEVVESTCLPLLGVLDIDDVKIFLGLYPQIRKSEFLFMLITFFNRVSILLASRTPPNLLQLISKSIELFRDHVEVGKDASQEDFDYLLLSKSIAEILMDRDQVSMAAERLQSLSHKGSMRANAAIGFALGTLPTSRMGVVSNEYSKWTPVILDAPSTMEVLVQSQLFGTVSLEQLSITGLEDLSLAMRVRMGFAEARKKAFFNAAGILEPLIGEVEKTYGKASLELLLVGTALVNSFNATKREVDGENLGRYVWSNLFGSFTTISLAGPAQQTYLMVAISDSFLGQGKYLEARKFLLDVLHRNSTDSNLLMSVTLRLLKMSRRERSPSTFFEDWTMLGNAVRRFDKLSNTLKYECIEETVCILSVLEPDQMAKIPEASRIVKTLTDYRISTYTGSTPSRLNLHRNLEDLKRLKNKLNLFSISGPQLSYCRKLRERFLPASVQIIEKVGSANWQRFKRIKEIDEMEVPMKAELQTLGSAKSAFQDSVLGSSLKMDSNAPLPPKAARSVTSIRSFMSCEEDAIVLPPIPPKSSTGKRICYICKNSISVEKELQWRAHAFSDLRPYVCIVDDCDADCMDFTSRATFAAHLNEHQHINLWTCAQCGHTEEKMYLILDHVSFKHATDDNGDQNVNVIQKSIPRDLSRQSCPFCGEVPGAVKFVGHLCHHLEEISLSAIPRDVEVNEDDEESSSGASLSRRKIGELGGRFDEPFDEIDIPNTSSAPSNRISPVSAQPHLSMAAPQGYLSRPSYSGYALPAMAGPIMSNVYSPGNQMALVGGINMQYPPHQMGGLMYGHHPGQQQQQIDRPFKCDQCPQSFNRNHDLKRHKRIHLAVKPFPCGHCNKSFNRKDALKRHILVKGCGKRYMNDASNANRDSQSPVDKSEVMSDSTEDNSPEMKEKEL